MKTDALFVFYFIYATESWYYNTRLRIIINHEKEENLMKFGENLRNLRKVKKLSQENLAEKMKVSRQSVSKWKIGMLLYK